MARRVEDLDCWRLADQLRQLIIKHTAEGTSAGQDFRFTSNFRDAISSVCRNQSEGFAKYWHKPQKPFFSTARSSLAEVKDGIRDGVPAGTLPPRPSPTKCTHSTAEPTLRTCGIWSRWIDRILQGESTRSARV